MKEKGFPEEMISAAQRIIDAAEKIDEEEEFARAKFSGAVKPYIEAEKDGGFLHRDIRKRSAEEMLAKGLVPDLSDWMM